MATALKTGLIQSPRRTDGRLLCVALLPFFLLSEGIRRAVVGMTHDIQPQRAWFAEARSQASIATSYALLARSMLK